MNFALSLVCRLRREHREGGGVRVGHHAAHLWETDPGQQRGQPLLLRHRGARPARPGVGDVAAVNTPNTAATGRRSKRRLSRVSSAKTRAPGSRVVTRRARRRTHFNVTQLTDDHGA